MLKGRESLIRLVGKRRRFLPNRHSILSAPTRSPWNLNPDRNGGEIEQMGSGEGSSNRYGEEKTVACPVCGVKVENNLINSHLDACLSRGTKRKLTQRTLLELNFSPKSKNKTGSIKSEELGNDLFLAAHGESPAQDASNGLSSVRAVEEFQHQVDSPSGDPINIVKINEVPDFDVTIQNDIYGVILETFIVGRRFGDEIKLYLGARFHLSRDPDNVKDPNAIKVIYSDLGCPKVLGFLPRKVAEYLAPLIDQYHLNFEGCVTSVPNRSIDVVPIQIMCHKTSNSKEHCSDEAFKCLWKKVQQVIETTKTGPLSSIKYQDNFCVFMHEVLRNSCHLLTDEEKNFMESFTSMPDDSQRLFVRLYSRKGPWFRLCMISYPEVLDPQEAVKELSEIGFTCCFEISNALCDDNIKEILDMLTVSELREIYCTLKLERGARVIKLFSYLGFDHLHMCFKSQLKKSGIFIQPQLIDLSKRLQSCNRGMRKQDLITCLISSYKQELCPLLPSMVFHRTGSCVRISSKAESLIWRAERLFFLNGEQDLSAFLLVDLGIVKYPTYKCIVSQQIFSDRDGLLSYEEAIEVAQIADEALDESDTILVMKCIGLADSHIPNTAVQSSTSESMAPFLSRFSASYVYSKVVLLGISFLERERRYSDAIFLLKRLLNCFTNDGRRGYWTLRLSIDLEHMGYLNESLLIAENGLLDEWVRAGSRVALQRRVLRLGKPPRRWKTPSFSESVKRKITEVHVQGRPLNSVTGIKSRYYGEDGEQCGVEQLALQYYAGEGGWQGVHTESGIWLTIFGILMWDVIFSEVPNVFRTRFQTAPLDLETDSFYLVRKSHIESHLQKIHDGMGEEILITSWESHEGTACRGVNWGRHPLTELRAAVTCIGGPCVATFCRHLALDYRGWSSGMPDLLLWRFHGEYRGEAKLVEVKGPRDRLCEQQRAWLLLLMDCGFNAEVCKVSPIV